MRRSSELCAPLCASLRERSRRRASHTAAGSGALGRDATHAPQNARWWMCEVARGLGMAPIRSPPRSDAATIPRGFARSARAGRSRGGGGQEPKRVKHRAAPAPHLPSLPRGGGCLHTLATGLGSDLTKFTPLPVNYDYSAGLTCSRSKLAHPVRTPRERVPIEFAFAGPPRLRHRCDRSHRPPRRLHSLHCSSHRPTRPHRRRTRRK